MVINITLQIDIHDTQMLMRAAWRQLVLDGATTVEAEATIATPEQALRTLIHDGRTIPGCTVMAAGSCRTD